MPGVRRRDGYWQIWWMTDDARYWGRLEFRDYPKKKDAQKEAMRRELDGEMSVAPNVAFIKVAAWVLSDKNASPISCEKCNKFIRDFNVFLSEMSIEKMRDITCEIIRKYIRERTKKYEPATINRELGYLREICNKAVDKSIIRISPMKGIKSLKVERKISVLPTKEEGARILGWFREKDPLFYAWFYFELTRGWRQGEFRTIRVNDVDLENQILYTLQAKTEPRINRLSEEDCLVLNEHIILLKEKRLYRPSGFLFPPIKKGKLVSRNTMLRKIKRACKDLGITKNITNHSFRHLVVTTILDKTANIDVVKAITGHKDTKTILEHYTHATTENTREGLEYTRVDTGLLLKKNVPERVPRKGIGDDVSTV